MLMYQGIRIEEICLVNSEKTKAEKQKLLREISQNVHDLLFTFSRLVVATKEYDKKQVELSKKFFLPDTQITQEEWIQDEPLALARAGEIKAVEQYKEACAKCEPVSCEHTHWTNQALTWCASIKYFHCCIEDERERLILFGNSPDKPKPWVITAKEDVDQALAYLSENLNTDSFETVAMPPAISEFFDRLRRKQKNDNLCTKLHQMLRSGEIKITTGGRLDFINLGSSVEMRNFFTLYGFPKWKTIAGLFLCRGREYSAHTLGSAVMR